MQQRPAARIRDIWKQRIGYGVADFASNLVWQMITLYMMFFYTDVVGLKAIKVGLLFFVVRITAGAADILMGLVIDKTTSRWGQARPYYLWGAIPFGVFSLLAFYVPDLGSDGKITYAYITYLGLSIAYTVVNIPQTAILPMLTRDAHERTVLSSSRIFFSFIGAAVVSAFTLHMVETLGDGSRARGFFFTMMIFAISGTLMFIYTFTVLREKVKLSKRKVTLKDTISSIKTNPHWVIFAFNIIFMWGAYFFQQGSMIYYFTYNLRLPELAIIIATISTLAPLAGVISASVISKRFFKRTIFQFSSGIYLSGIIIILFANLNVPLIIIGAVISGLGFGLRHTIYFSMQADPVDYTEWKTGYRIAGTMSAVNGFIGKIAMAAEGVVSGFILSVSHYSPGKLQDKSALFAIKLNYLLVPIGLTIISMIIMSFYNLDKIYPAIRAELEARVEEPQNNHLAG
jgi:GPH family glycoside/pentoside/hexuronide:cation symporter